MRLAISLLLVGCSAQLGPANGGGGGGKEDDFGPDAAVIVTADAQVDAAPVQVADNTCGVASTHGDLGTVAGQARSAVQEGTSRRVGIVSAATPATAAQAAPDVIVVQLWDNYGPFAGGAARTGTFQLTGTELDYDTCGVCVLQLANVANNTPAKLLFATAGTVTVTSVGTTAGQTIQLSISNASFVEIVEDTINGGYRSVAGSTCTSPITNVVLSGTI